MECKLGGDENTTIEGFSYDRASNQVEFLARCTSLSPYIAELVFEVNTVSKKSHIEKLLVSFNM